MQDMQRIASDAGLPDYGLFKPDALQAQAAQVKSQGLIAFGSDNGVICPKLKKRALRIRGFRCIGGSGTPTSYTLINSTSLI